MRYCLNDRNVSWYAGHIRTIKLRQRNIRQQINDSYNFSPMTVHISIVEYVYICILYCAAA